MIYVGSKEPWLLRVDQEEYLEYSKMAIAVEGVMKTKTLTGCNGLAGSKLQDEGVPSEH